MQRCSRVSGTRFEDSALAEKESELKQKGRPVPLGKAALELPYHSDISVCFRQQW
jgi:hypothetical protein